MTLHTTSDGQITYEGLPVVNQEEVKKWLWENDREIHNPVSLGNWEKYLLPKRKELELPDDEFKAMYVWPAVAILRKPVSEEGEKNNGLGGPSSLEDEAERFFNENYSGTATSDFLKPYIINTYITAVKTRKP